MMVLDGIGQMLSNPLIRRYRCSLMRPRQFWIYMTIYIALVVLLLFINYTVYRYRQLFYNPESFFRSVFFQFLAIEVLVLWLWGAYNSSSAVREEIVEKTYDFFRLLPLPARQKAIGILLGKNLVVLLVAGINFVLLLFFGLAGKVSAYLQVQIFLLLASVAVLANTLSLLSSIHPGKKRKQSGIAVVFLLVVLILPMLIGTLVELSGIEGMENISAKFYQLDVPLLLLISLIVLYFSCWSIKGVLRKFTREDEPLFTRKGALLFMLGYEFILFGLFYAHLSQGTRTVVNYMYWMHSLVPALLIPVWAIRGFDRYVEYSGLMQRRLGPNRNMLFALLRYCNPSLALGLFAIWAAGSAGTTLMTGQELLPHLYLILVLFSFYLFFVLLLELHVVYTPLSSKTGLLLGFIVVVHTLFPLILSAIFENGTICLYSLLGFFFHIFSPLAPGILPQTSVLVVNLILCTVPILLTWKRYAHIFAVREKM